MAVVGGIVIAAAEGVARAKPGTENVDDRLPACFARKCASALGERAPTCVLDGTPEEDIELAVILRAEEEFASATATSCCARVAVADANTRARKTLRTGFA
jgi:hypothetical protein